MNITWQNKALFALASMITINCGLCCTQEGTKRALLNLNLIFDESPDTTMALGFNSAIRKDLNVLASLPLLLHDSAQQTFLDIESRRIFIDTAHTLVLILSSAEQRSLAELDLNSKAWHQIQPNDLGDIFTKENREHIPIDDAWIENFSQLFLPRSTVAKHIFLDGHGLTDVQIAGIPIPLYNKFLTILAKINTQFLWILSCYTGGTNLLTMQKSMQDNTKAQPYIIVVESVGEITALGSKSVDKTALFDTLNQFFDQPYPPFYLGHPITTTIAQVHQKITLLDVIKAYFNDDAPTVNLPSVYIPGADFFRAIDVDHEFIITALALKRMRIAEKIEANVASREQLIASFDQRDFERIQKLWQQLKPLLAKKTAELSTAEQETITSLQDQYKQAIRLQVLQKKQALKEIAAKPATTLPPIPLIVDESIKHILLYPIDLNPLVFQILGTTSPNIFSKIAGNGHHFIKEFDAKKTDLTAIINSFTALSVSGGFYYEGAHAYFIDTMICKTDGLKLPIAQETVSLQPVCIFKEVYIKPQPESTEQPELTEQSYAEPETSPYAIIACSPARDIYNIAMVPLPAVPHDLAWQTVTRNQFIKIILYMHDKTIATEQAIFAATAGMENTITQQQSFDRFLTEIGVSEADRAQASQEDIEPLLQQAFQKIDETISLSFLSKKLGEALEFNYDPAYTKEFRENLEQKIQTLISQSEQEKVIDFINRSFKADQITFALNAAEMMIKQNLGSSILPIAAKLLEERTSCEPYHIKNLFKTLINNGYRTEALQIIKDFAAPADPANPVINQTITSVLPTLLPAFLQEFGYEPIKPILDELAPKGLPFENLIEQMIIYEDLDQIAQKIITDRATSDKAYAEHLEQIAAAAKKEGEELAQAESFAKEPASAITDLIDPAANHFHLKTTFMAIRSWIEHHELSSVASVLAALIEKDITLTQNTNATNHAKKIITMITEKPDTLAEFAKTIQELITSDDAQQSREGSILAVAFAQQLGKQFMPSLISELKAQSKLYQLKELGILFAEQENFQQAAEIADVLNKEYYIDGAQEIRKKLPKER